MSKNEKSRSQNEKDRRITARRHTRILALGALLAALSFLLGYVAKVLQGGNPLRLTFEGLPIVFAGLTLGPLAGGLSGVVADLLSCLLSGQVPNPLIAVGAALIGVLPALLSRGSFYTHRPHFLSILLCDGVAHAVGSLTVKGAALAIFFGFPFETVILRVPIYLAVILAESLLLFALLRSYGIRRELERILR